MSHVGGLTRHHRPAFGAKCGNAKVSRTSTIKLSPGTGKQMGWSTQELADLAGTTLRTVRHYHDVGLLPSPPRNSNGYKNYGVSHLTLLLRIRRLVELGAPLSEIRHLDLADMQHQESDEYTDKLRELDEEAEAAIRRLHAIRAQISHELAVHPQQGSRSLDGLGPADEEFMTVASRILSDESLSAWNTLREQVPGHQALVEFSQLTEDANPDELTDLPDRLAAVVHQLHAEAPELASPTFASARGQRFGQQALQVAVAELYNLTQLEVLLRTSVILSDQAATPED